MTCKHKAGLLCAKAGIKVMYGIGSFFLVEVEMMNFKSEGCKKSFEPVENISRCWCYCIKRKKIFEERCGRERHKVLFIAQELINTCFRSGLGINLFDDNSAIKMRGMRCCGGHGSWDNDRIGGDITFMNFTC